MLNSLLRDQIRPTFLIDAQWVRVPVITQQMAFHNCGIGRMTGAFAAELSGC